MPFNRSSRPDWQRVDQVNEPLFIAGPTAVGKSDLAIALAEITGGEIISVDSMQVYRGLDIGTAKPSPAERTRIPHHLIDVVDLRESFDAARFVALARTAVAQIQSRGRTPIFCGGTGLYFKAFLEGIGHAPASDSLLREELRATPLAELLRELRERDPETFERIDRQNPRRVIRAVEVIRLTGKSISQLQSKWLSPAEAPEHRCPIIGLVRPIPELDSRISVRVDAMFQSGLVEETAQLLERGLAENITAMQALGYRQVVEHLRGEHSLEDAVALVKARTRQFARRQMKWFRRQLPMNWVTLTPESSVETAARELHRQVLSWNRPAGLSA